jgi:hypothetical protein
MVRKRHFYPEAAGKVARILGKMGLPAICYALLMNVILLTYVYYIRSRQK